MKMKVYFLLLFFATINYGQILTWEPVYFTEDSSVTIVYDATKGTGGLAGYNGDVYAHTGVLLASGSGTQDWYAAPTWLNNDARYKMTRIGTDLYELEITPSVFEYYSTAPTDKPIGASDEITHLAFVFRNADGSKEGKGEGNTDLFIGLKTGVNFVRPAESPYNTELNEQFTVTALGSSITDTLKLFVGENLVQTSTEDSVTYEVTATQYKEWVKVIGTTTLGLEVSDSIYYYVNPQVVEEDLPQGIVEGVTYHDDDMSATLTLYAENKDYVYVIGDFNNWEIDPDYFMKRSTDGKHYWLKIDNLNIGKEYAFQYLVEGDLRIADPYTHKVLDPWNDSFIPESVYPNLKPYPVGKTQNIVSVLQTAQTEYEWQVDDFERSPQEELIIYELLVRDFVDTHSYDTLIDTLSYLEALGVNAIELMPINEFEGNSSWGYNPSFMFAVDKYYGTANDLKHFIDECHKRGIAVILDMVLNHQFGQSPLVRLYWDDAFNRPSVENPWFNQVAKHDFNVGYDFNHESELTQKFVDRVNRYWIEEFKFDGYRFDLSKGFMQNGSFYDYNQSRIDLLKRMYDKVREFDNNAYMILEHLGANNEEIVLSDYGFMLWGKMTDPYNEATMGYNDDNKSDFSWVSHKVRGWNDPHLVGYMESHDEERIMFKNLEYGNSSGSYNIKELVTALQRVKMAGAFFFTVPGPKMIWQFGELGYDISIDENGRTGEKPILWEYYDNIYRYKLYQTFSVLIDLRKNYEVFNTTDFTLNVGGSTKTMQLNHESMNVFIIGNFGVGSNTIPLDFQNEGTWYDYFSGDSVEYSGTKPVEVLEPGEFHIYTTEKLPTPEGDVLSSVDEIEEELSKEFYLSQNYPNPFNPSTVIKFTLPQSSFVRLKVYNVLGQEVKTLFSNDLNPGVFEVTWDGTDSFGSQMTSGIYFYRLEADNFFQTRKMILLK